MNRTIEDIQKDIELLGIKGGYDIEQLLTPQDCRRLSYEIERLNNIINKIEQYLIDSGVDNDILKCCVNYDVNGVELRGYIEELKGSDK